MKKLITIMLVAMVPFITMAQKKSKKDKFRKALKLKSKEKKWLQPMKSATVTLGDSPMDESREGAWVLGRWVPPESARRIKYGDRHIEEISEDQALKIRRQQKQTQLSGAAQLKKKRRKRRTKKYSKRRTKKSRNRKYKPKNKSRRKDK